MVLNPKDGFLPRHIKMPGYFLHFIIINIYDKINIYDFILLLKFAIICRKGKHKCLISESKPF